MNRTAFNVSMGIGVGLIGSGTALLSVPAAFMVVGALVIGLTLHLAKTAGVR